MKKQSKNPEFSSTLVSQFSLKENPDTLKTECPLENSLLCDQPELRQQSHIKFLQDADSSNNSYYYIDNELLSEQSPQRPSLQKVFRKVNPAFATFGNLSEEQDKNKNKKQNEREQGKQKRVVSNQIKLWNQKANQVHLDLHMANKCNHVNFKSKDPGKNQNDPQNGNNPTIFSRQQAEVLDNSSKINENNLTKQSKIEVEKSKPIKKTVDEYQLESAQTKPISSPQTVKHSSNNQSQCFLQINNKKWDKVMLRLTKSKLQIGPIVVELQKIMKIKIFPSQLCEQSKVIKSTDLALYKQQIKMNKSNIIKVTTSENVFQLYQKYSIVALPQPKSSYSPSTLPQPDSTTNGPSSNKQFPLPYLSFARIIMKKLKQLNSLNKPTDWQVPQFAPRTLINKSDEVKLGFSSNKYRTKNYVYIHGNIYKKSQHKGSWEKRYIIINQSGVYSFRHEKDESHSFSIESRSIKYLWTWFTTLKVDKEQDKSGYITIACRQDFSKELAEELKKPEKQNDTGLYNPGEQNTNSYLIIKVKHGFNGQTQFAIPICSYDNDINGDRNWLLAFYRLLEQEGR